MDLEEEVETDIERQIKAYREKLDRLEGERAIAQGHTVVPTLPTFDNVPPPPPPGRVEQSKPAGTAFSPLDDDAMTNFDDEELDEFKELYDFFVFVARQRLNKNEFESESVASDWVKCWTVLGYTYSSLLTLVTDFLRKKANGLVPFDLLPKKLWEELNVNRQRLPQKVSASFLVDRTIEHFKMLMKSNPARFKDTTIDPVLVDLEPDDEPSFKVEVLEQPPDFDIPEVSSTTNTFAESGQRPTEGSSGETVDFISANKEMYDFMWQKMGGIAGSLQTTNLTTESVMNVIVESGLNAASIVALYGCDRYYIEASTVHQDIEHRRPSRIHDLLYAFLCPVSLGLPQVCSLESLIAFLMEYCLESKYVESFLTPDAFDAYNIALQGLPQTTPEVKKEVSPSHVPSTSQQQKFKPRSPPQQYHDASDSFGDDESLPDVDDDPNDVIADDRGDRQWSNQPPRIIDARDFKFTHGEDALVHEKPDHPMCRLGPMPLEDFDQCLKVFCHIESLGEGILGSDLLQIGAYAEDGQKIFVPILPPKTSRSMLEKLGYKTRSQSGRKHTSDSKITYQHKVERSVACESVKEGIRSLLTFFEKSLKQDPHSDGVLLVFLHPENLMDLTRELWILKNKRFLEKFSIVKGVIFVEEIVRNYFIRDREAADKRLSLEDVCTIIFRDDFGDITEADQKAKMLFMVSRRMSKSDILRGKILARRMSESRWALFDAFFRQLKTLRELQQFVSKKLTGESDPIQLRGLFSMFPNLLYRDSLSKYNEKELTIAAKFVELLVSSGLVRDKLSNMYGTRNPNHLFSEIKTVVLNDLTPQPYAVVTQLESCIAATIDWLKKEGVGQSKPQQRHSSSRVDDSLDFELSSPSHSPPPRKSTRMNRTPDSQSSSSGRLNPEFAPLRDVMARELNLKFQNMAVAYDIATQMAQVWSTAGYSLESLRDRINSYSDEDGDKAVAAQLQFVLKKREQNFPPRWRGHGIDFVVDSTIKFLQQKRPVSRSLAKADSVEFVELISEDEIDDNGVEEPPKSTRSHLDQKELGFGNTKRIISQEDLRKWKRASDILPDVMKKLDKFCEFAKGANNMFEGVNNAIIMLDLINLMDRNGLSVEELYDRWIGSADRIGLQKDLTSKIFGDFGHSKVSKNYQGSSDFDVYRELFVKLFDIFATVRGKASSDSLKSTMTGSKKRSRPDSESEVKTSKKLRPTTESSTSSSSEEEKPSQSASEIIQTLNNYLDSNYDSYAKARVCPLGFRRLHEFIFFNENLRKLELNNLAQIVNDFIGHLVSAELSHDNLFEVAKKFVSEATEFPDQKLNAYLQSVILNEDFELPQTCWNIFGTLIDIVTRYFRLEICSEKLSAEAFQIVDYPWDQTNGLFELGLHLSRCLVVETQYLIRSKVLEGMTLSDLDMEEVKSWALQITDGLVNLGFTVFGAVQWYSTGVLKDRLREILSAGNLQLQPDVLISTCDDWIEALIKRQKINRLPHKRKLLRKKILFLVKSGQIVSKDVADRVTVRRLPSRIIVTDRSNQSNEDIVKKEPNCEIEMEEPFIKRAGNVVTLDDVTLEPGQSKVVIAALCDVPRIRTRALMNLLPAPAINDTSGTISDKSILFPNYRLEVKISNDHKSNQTANCLFFPRGTVIALAIVEDCKRDVAGPRSSALYCLLLLRHYCMVTSGDMSDIVCDADGNLSFGHNFEISLNKNSEVLFHKSTGTNQRYTVEMVISFLTHYKNSEIGGSGYPNYLQEMLREGAADIVSERDAESLYKFLHGKTRWGLPKPKKIVHNQPKDVQRGTTKNFEFPEFHGYTNCLAEAANVGGDLILKLIQIQTEKLNVTDVEAKDRLEDFLSILHDMKKDCPMLQQLATRVEKSKTTFQTIFWEQLVEHYEKHPNACSECRPLKNEACIENLSLSFDSSSENFKNLFSLVRLFPVDNVSLIEKFVEMSDNKPLADSGLSKDAVEGLKMFVDKLKSNLMFEKRSRVLNDLQRVEKEGKKPRLSVYAAHNNQVISYLIVSPEHDSPISAGSRFLNSVERSQPAIDKHVIAASWAVSENKTLLERAPFTILTNSPNPVAFFSSHIKMNARLAGFVYESTYLTDGNPAQVLCNRSGLEEVLARKNPLLHLRQTVELVVSELLKSRNVLTSGDCERKRVQRSAENAPKQFSIPKTITLDVEKVLSQIQRKEFKVNLNNSEWFLSILDDKTETELWLCELKRIKVRKDFMSMKNYFDKSLFETFGDSVEDSTSLEMIDAWIQARCDPEALEKVFEENFKVDSSSDSSTVQIYQSLLLECCDVLPEGTNIDFLAKATFEFFASYNESRRSNLYPDQTRKKVLEIQSRNIDRTTYRHLEQYYSDAFASQIDDAKRISSLIVDVWIMLGFKFDSLSMMFNSAATFNVCFDLVIYKLNNLLRKVTNLLDFDLNSVKILEVTLMFFRGRILTDNSRKTVSRGDSWHGWFVTNTPSDVSETDVETVAKELGTFGPIQLLELYRQVVLTTSGVPNSVVRTSICHALVTSASSTFQSSMEKIFNYFLKIEEVEDGELTSDSDDDEAENVQRPNLKQQLPGSMTKVVEKSPEENLIFRFDEIQLQSTANQSKERQQFLTETQSQILVGDENPVDSSSSFVEHGLLERIRQKLYYLTLNVGLKCQLNWKQISELVSFDLVASLEKCDKSQIDYVVDELRDVIFGDPDDDDEIRAVALPRLYHNLLDIILQNSEDFSPLFAFHEFVKDLLSILEDLVKQAGPRTVADNEENVVPDVSVVVEEETDIVTQEQSYYVKQEVKQERDEEMSSPESPSGEFQDHFDISSEIIVRNESEAASPEVKWEDCEKQHPELISIDVENEHLREEEDIGIFPENPTSSDEEEKLNPSDIDRTEAQNKSTPAGIYESPESPPDPREDFGDPFETPRSPDFESLSPVEEQHSYLANQPSDSIKVDAVPDDSESPESPTDDGQNAAMMDLPCPENECQSPTIHSEHEIPPEQSVVSADGVEANMEPAGNDQDVSSMTELSYAAPDQINEIPDLPEIANPEKVEDISTKQENMPELPNVE